MSTVLEISEDNLPQIKEGLKEIGLRVSKISEKKEKSEAKPKFFVTLVKGKFLLHESEGKKKDSKEKGFLTDKASHIKALVEMGLIKDE